VYRGKYYLGHFGVQHRTGVGKNHDNKKIKNIQFFDFEKMFIFASTFYQIFETGLSAQ